MFELYVQDAPRSVSSAESGFAEPDWQGDRDYAPSARMTQGGLDEILQGLEDVIRSGAEAGWLDAYRTRRASFDLQSIRGQLARERGRVAGALEDKAVRAILSRADRLASVLRCSAPFQG
ncbi:MAG: hypothetical protein P4L64_09120 [Caulobacteraceae bacterium]|nr:hypothetical protein [Caulobacteraceae bacterium]